MMAPPMSANSFLAALVREGLDVVQVGDWRDHNRNHKGPWGPVHGVMIHHTVTKGSARTVDICRHGYSSLPGPLCHGVITKDGRVHLVGYGRANHAGSGDPDVLAAVIAERDLPTDNEATTDGNRHFYGFECENLGDGDDPWPEEQLEAIERAAAAVCRLHGWNERSVIGHREWQPGKVDPRGFSMGSMRARVQERLTHPAGWNRHDQEDDMALSDADIDRMARRVWELDGFFAVPWGTKENPEWAPESVLRHVGEVTRESRGRIKELQAAVGALSGVVSRLAEGGGLTAAEAEAAAEAGARRALAGLGDVLTDQA